VDFVYLDPTAEPGVPVSPYDRRLDPEAADVTIGLLANSFVDSEEFLSQVAGRLRTVVPRLAFKAYDKTSPTRASEVISDEDAIVMKNECVGVITAYGH
jgi:hypothetical protein